MLDQPDQRDLLPQLEKDFTDVPPEHHVDGRADMPISVPHANSEDAAALFSSNSAAGSGLVLPHQESLAASDTNASSSDHTSTPVRQGFLVYNHLNLSDLDDQGIRAFFETFRLALLLARNWYPGDKHQYAIRGHRHYPKTPYPKSAKNATFMTLGTSTSDFDIWEVGEGTGEIGELEMKGPRGLGTGADLGGRQNTGTH